MKTNKGLIVLEIDGNAAPLTAGNFLDLAGKAKENKEKENGNN